MSEHPVMTPAWIGFCKYAARKPEIKERFTRETEILLVDPDKYIAPANDSDALTPFEAAMMFAYWLFLTHWGSEVGVSAEFVRQARAAFPLEAQRRDAGWDKRLESVL